MTGEIAYDRKQNAQNKVHIASNIVYNAIQRLITRTFLWVRIASKKMLPKGGNFRVVAP